MDGALVEADNPRRPSRRMDFETAVQVWLLHFEGHLNSRIAARLDINQGRVSEVVTGKRFPGSRAAAQARLID
jgi:hypothetical protein